MRLTKVIKNYEVHCIDLFLFVILIIVIDINLHQNSTTLCTFFEDHVGSNDGSASALSSLFLFSVCWCLDRLFYL